MDNLILKEWLLIRNELDQAKFEGNSEREKLARIRTFELLEKILPEFEKEEIELFLLVFEDYERRQNWDLDESDPVNKAFLKVKPELFRIARENHNIIVLDVGGER